MLNILLGVVLMYVVVRYVVLFRAGIEVMACGNGVQSLCNYIDKIERKIINFIKSVSSVNCLRFYLKIYY